MGLGRVETVGDLAPRGGPEKSGVFTVSFAYFPILVFLRPPFAADWQCEPFLGRFTV